MRDSLEVEVEKEMGDSLEEQGVMMVIVVVVVVVVVVVEQKSLAALVVGQPGDFGFGF